MRKIRLMSAALMLFVLSAMTFASPVQPPPPDPTTDPLTCRWHWWDGRWQFTETAFFCPPGWLCFPPVYEGGFEGETADVDCRQNPGVTMDSVPQPMPAVRLPE